MDCRDAMSLFLPDNSVDSIVCDPPYGLSFMGKDWDHGVPCVATWQEALRVLKPGGHLLSFGGSRMYHRMAVAVEDAGFEIRDQIMWIYGSGFPKSHNGDWGGTALKPAHEPIVMARKPLVGTVEANWSAWGTGALNIDGGRVEGGGAMKWVTPRGGIWATDTAATARLVPNEQGRWPANLIHDGSEEVLALFPDSKGQQGDVRGTEPSGVTNGIYGEFAGRVASTARGDTGSAARFFYCAKASKKDRGEGNAHPTVKPTDLMAYLCRLVTPPGGVVLDPFMGSGSTGKAAMREGFRFIGCEIDASYFAIAQARIAAGAAT